MSESEEDVVLPRFFKVFLSETASELMAIPKSFNEHLKDPLPQRAKLQGIGGGVWTVSFKKIHDYMYFTSGWSKFAEDHKLNDGEFLTFVYDGSHTFEVSVFGRSGCKEVRAVVETVELSDTSSNKEEEEDDRLFSVEEEEVSQSVNLVDSEENVSTTEVVSGFSSLEVEPNPFFTTTLKNRIYELLIPANVVKEHDLTFCDTIKYIDGEGIMNGKRGKWCDDRVCFKGWDRICRRNRLKEYDTIHCEMLHTRKEVHSIKITITRG